ncbi:related to fluconazole resistance protein (FLU1) [Rhynchosporium agropyri]|uniref:Related to fluconazole resistance protein (FLU1) n=1 Tax=Rhynchosporium agropyri TaxID=914238 RepID=A0A1E1KG68_9HELO|nr:related to fluconazole resistance protein (FLU1) [Rhynchosporium agropyri]
MKEPEDVESNGLSNTEKILTFEEERPSLNPHNWSTTRKTLILAINFALVVNATNGTSLASGGVKATVKHFGVEDAYGWRVLPVSIYLIGYSIGSVLLAPLSEDYGRRPVNLLSTFGFMIGMVVCAVAPTWAVFIIARLFTGVFAAGPPSTAGGICADLYAKDLHRGHAILGYNMATQIGAVFGPIISGWAVMHSWSLPFWVGLGIGAFCLTASIVGMPETNHNVILNKRAKQIQQTQQTQIPRGPLQGKKFVWKEFATKTLLRPLFMLKEQIVLFSCLYIAFQYAVFYIFLQSYPIIYEGIYSFNTGEDGLTFIGFGIGVLLTVPAQYAFDQIYKNALSKERPWTKHHGAKRLPPACASGPLIVLSLFLSAWTSKASIHWIFSALSGIPYGLGYILNLNALLNYMVDSYKTYASSASSASSITRQMMGAMLPFAAVPMYRKLGVDWASSLLGFCALVMAAIPFLFWIYGEKMLEKSKLAQKLAEDEKAVG